MKKIAKTGLLSLTFLTLSLLTLGAIRFSHEDFQVAKAEEGPCVGEVSITAVKHYDPYWQSGANTNEHFIIQLEGSDYPTYSSGITQYFDKSVISPYFTANIATHLELFDRSGGRVNVNDYWQVYACQERTSKGFSFGLLNFGDSASAIIREGFKIPSYAMLKGNTSSETYGYYTVDKTYLAKLINTAPRSEGVRDWTIQEYNPRSVDITAVYSYVDGDNEFLTFNLFGSGLDYPQVSGQGNYHFDISQVDTLLPNFYEKIHFYDSNSQLMNYSINNLITIDLWTLYPTISVGINVLRQANRVHIEPGLIVPSYARHTGDTSSEVYDGFIVSNELVLTIDGSASHETGARIPWSTVVDEVGTLSLSMFKTNHPFKDSNTNEFFIFQFNEETDFINVRHDTHWDTNLISLLDNFASYFELYNASGSKMDARIISSEVLFNYMFPNSVSIMIEGGASAVRAVIKQGFHFPTYALYTNDYSSSNYGNYAIATTYNLNIQEGASHTEGVVNDWPLPYCSVEYYDENEVLISSLTDSVVLGASYTLVDAPEKEGYVNTWQLMEPAGLVVENNSFIAPLEAVTIRFKTHYEKIPVCEVEYYNEEGKLIPDYSVTVKCGETYLLQPVLSKKGHDGSWRVLEPEGITIVNSQITVPSYETTIKFKAHYVPRTYQISFEGVVAEPIIVTYGAQIGDLPAIPEIVGKTGNWVIDETIITPETIYEFDDDKVATIEYTDRICTITFVTDDIDLLPMQLVYGTVVESLPTPSKEGYFFNGWYLENGEEYKAGQPLVDDITLYAHWLAQCTVTFDSDGGSLIQSVTLGEGQLLNKPTNPTKEGYEFICWTLNGEEFDFSTPITESITLVAKWKETAKPVEPVEPEKPKISGGVIALIVASSVVLVAGAGLLIFLIIRKKKMK